jgi:hypothetical protein
MGYVERQNVTVEPHWLAGRLEHDPEKWIPVFG